MKNASICIDHVTLL